MDLPATGLRKNETGAPLGAWTVPVGSCMRVGTPDRWYAGAVGGNCVEILWYATRHPEDDLFLVPDHVAECRRIAVWRGCAQRPELRTYSGAKDLRLRKSCAVTVARRRGSAARRAQRPEASGQYRRYAQQAVPGDEVSSAATRCWRVHVGVEFREAKRQLRAPAPARYHVSDGYRRSRHVERPSTQVKPQPPSRHRT